MKLKKKKKKKKKKEKKRKKKKCFSRMQTPDSVFYSKLYIIITPRRHLFDTSFYLSFTNKLCLCYNYCTLQ